MSSYQPDKNFTIKYLKELCETPKIAHNHHHVKISPITFTSSFEPKLKEFWEDKGSLENAQVVIERSHNFTLERTGLSVWSKAAQGQSELHCFLELTNVPQQDEKAAMNCLIRLASGQTRQILMVLNDETEYAQWGDKLLQTISELIELALHAVQNETVTETTSKPSISEPEESDDREETAEEVNTEPESEETDK